MRLHCFTLILCMFLGASCSHTVDPHSHVWIGEHSQNVWTYLRVEKTVVGGQTAAVVNDYYKGALANGESFVLEGGIKVSNQNGQLHVNGTKIPKKVINVLIDRDGSVKHNQFIRTFK